MSDGSIQALEIVFHGIVQGVGFRYTSYEIARSFPEISGWVRNEPDGTVRMFVQGPEPALSQYLRQLATESRLARLIDDIVRHPAMPDASLTHFRIERF